MAARLEIGLQLREVVNLAVVGDPQPSVVRRHRLVASGREVHDREPSVRETHVSGGMQPFVIGPAMRDQDVHPTKDRTIHGLAAQEIDASDYSAHVVIRASSSKRW